MSNKTRLFIAVTAPNTPELQATLHDLENLGSSVKPVATDGLHVTLKFLGEIDDERIPQITSSMQQIAGAMPAFTLPLVGLGAFPRVTRPTVVWCGLQNAEGLGELAEKLDSQLHSLGFPREARPFHPHLTLARIKNKPPAQLQAFIEQGADRNFGQLAVNAITLYQSELLTTGAKYTAMTSVALASADA